MKKKILFVSLFVLLVTVFGVVIADAQGPRPGTRAPSAALGTTFTYQGQLKNNGAVVNVSCDLVFGLWDAASSGTQIGANITQTLAINNGLFTTQLDFGANAFKGEARWLDISVRCPAGGGSYTALTSRQALTPAPYAFALPGLYTQQNATSPNIIGGYSGNTVDSGVYGATISGGGRQPFFNHISANLGTIGGGSYNTVSGVLCTIGGGEGNHAGGSNCTIAGGTGNVTSGHGAVIGGGGYDGSTYAGNTASGNAATVAGGLGNTASFTATTIGGGQKNMSSDSWSTIGGGYSNTVSSAYATIGGGYSNKASGHRGTVAGGDSNSASGIASFVGGGEGNTASGNDSVVPGGIANSATMSYTFAAGRRAAANHIGTFVWADSYNNILGGSPFTSTGIDQFLIRAGGGVGINTNSPATSLQVAKDFSDSGSFGQIEAIGATNPNKRLTLGFDTTNNLGWIQASETFVAYRDLALNPNSGNVMIGTTSDSGDKLRVNGTIRVDTLGGAGSTGPLCLNASNQIATCSSSLRYKSNVANLNLGLDTVAQLRPVTFDWKDSGQPDLGFVAEEVNQVTPLLTTRNAAGQIEGVKYDRVSAVLVKAVQEQQKQIADLKLENATLETRVTALEQAIGRSPTTDLWNNGWMIGVLLIAVVLVGTRRWGAIR